MQNSITFLSSGQPSAGIFLSAPPETLVMAKVRRRLPQTVREENLNVLLDEKVDCTDFTAVRDKLMVMMLYATGMRRAELIGLLDANVGIDELKVLGGKVCVVSHSCNENINRDYSRNFGILPDDIFGWDLPEELRKPNDYALKVIIETYGFSPQELLVVDDMKLAYTMAKKQGVPIAFAAWGRKNCPAICEEMRRICDFSFDTPQEFGKFLFG